MPNLSPKVLFIAFLSLLSASCGVVVHNSTREDRALSYVGQVQLGNPTRVDEVVLVPVSYDGGQWHMNSAHVPVEVRCTIKDQDIDITVVTAVHSVEMDGAGFRMELPEECRGKYTVYYLDPDGTRHRIALVEIDD